MSYHFEHKNDKLSSRGEPMDQIKIGKFISELRKEKGMTQEQLAVKLGVTQKVFLVGKPEKTCQTCRFYNYCQQN